MDRSSRFSLCALFISVLAFYRALYSFLLGFILMDCASGLKLLAQMSDVGCGFFIFGFGSKLGSLLLLFLLFSLGFKVLQCGCLMRYFSEHSKEGYRVLKDGLCSKAISSDGFDGKWKDFCCECCAVSRELRTSSKTNWNHSLEERDGVLGFNLNDGVGREEKEVEEGEDKRQEELCNEDEVFDVIALRKMVKIQRRRANSIHTELEKERAAAASAADEALAMILRLQNEKSSLKLQYYQLCRLVEEKQVHDQVVVQSLRWIVMKHEAERSLLEEQLELCRERLKICSQGNEGDLLDCILDDPSTPSLSPSLSAGSRFEDALISSLDWDLSPM